MNQVSPNDRQTALHNKVPQVTLAFWIIKILATTVGETGGDALSMSLNLGYAVSFFIFFAIFIAVLAAQVSSTTYRPAFYWLVIVTTTTTGTEISDFLDRTAGLGYPRASLILFALVLLCLAVWRLSTGSVSVNNIRDRKSETFYWITILASNTLGTALGDFAADDGGLGFGGGAFVFGGAIALIALAYYATRLSHVLLFWAAFILTRPLGATLGDLLTKPHGEGGFSLSRIDSSLVIAGFMVAFVLLFSRSPERAAAPAQGD